MAYREGKVLTLEHIRTSMPSNTFFRELGRPRGWTRGLPGDDLHRPEVANVLRKLLQCGCIAAADADPIVQSCHSQGWIYSVAFVTEEKPAEVFYVLPSPLHHFYFEWKLSPRDATIPYATPFEMSVQVIKKFKPSQLSRTLRRAGPAGHFRPPEAAYQDEFYRAMFECTGGDVRISPEFTSAQAARQGYIDFFIPSKKWGIELLRDGSNLQEHASRFLASGAYGAWVLSAEMAGYIILDFRSTRPHRKHPGKTPHLQCLLQG